MKFLDTAKIHISSGSGGSGAVSFHREKYIEFGGPDGGNGGRGGNVWAEVVSGLNTLIDYRYQKHFKAKSGMHGMGRNRNGAKGKDLVLKVPKGTQIFSDDDNFLIADLVEEHERHLILRGGNGGFGNAYFKSSTNQAPRHANPGLPGKEMWLRLQLKMIADVGIIGMPNAGKSTFLSSVSAAKPKIANYPFTTLYPNLGIFRIDDKELLLVDIPGLIAGAHEGVGIGDRFLGHIERTNVLLHLVSAEHENVTQAYHTVRQELISYGCNIAQKPELVVLSKTDAFDKNTISKKLSELQTAKVNNFITPISSVTRLGINQVLQKLIIIVDNAKKKNTDEKSVL